MHPDLELALELADVADAITTARFRASDLLVETKPDLTPVSEADRAAEVAIRDVLARARPDDAVLGEEEGHVGESDRCWVLDPIDGTKNYVRGVPVWASLIALEERGQPVVGLVSAPALGFRWWSAVGEGAFRNGDPIQVSKVRSINDAMVSYGDHELMAELGRGAQFAALLAASWRSRGYGDFWSHMLVAEGAVDVGLDPVAAHWDMAAIRAIVEAAGGQFSSIDGDPSPAAGSGVSSNGLVHEAVLQVLST